MIDRISKLEDKKSLIDVKLRFEAERALLDPQDQDIDDYLFMYNAVVASFTLRDKMNTVIQTINAILDIVDPHPTQEP